jgi:RHS repeat-associated protein
VPFIYDGPNLAMEYYSGAVLRRYVPSGLGVDQPLVWYEGAGTSTPRWLQADNLGSVVAYSDASGNQHVTTGYGPFGEVTSFYASRYEYTGQLNIPELNLFDYKARAYDPTLGRFLSADPAGYASDINSYAYVGNDPVNGADPSGMDGTSDQLHNPSIFPRKPDPSTVVRAITVSFEKPPPTDNVSLHGPSSLGPTVRPNLGGIVGSMVKPGPTPSAPTIHCPAGTHAVTRYMLTTGYDNSYQSTQKNPGDRGYGLTASGTTAQSGTIAAPPTYPFGTQMYVPKYGSGVVLDRGGAIKNAHIDLWFPSTPAALNWGKQYENVQVCVAG